LIIAKAEYIDHFQPFIFQLKYIAILQLIKSIECGQISGYCTLLQVAGTLCNLQVGDCMVIDHQAFIGAIEVKTNIGSSNEFKKALIAQADFKEQMRHQGLFAIYAWKGISFNKAIETLWNFVREAPTKNYDTMPEVVYVRGKYFLRANRTSDRQSPPYQLWHISEDRSCKDCITEGQALLGLIASVWKFGKDTLLPWWLLAWHDQLGTVAGKSQDIPWPDDLKASIMHYNYG
jgi:hypothetical protein